MNDQPGLFDQKTSKVEHETMILYALGEFQSRGKVLAGRELPLERLLGAFRRAAEHFEIAETSDEEVADALRKLGANVVEVPDFVAKHPYRITVSGEIATKALGYYNRKRDSEE